MINLICFKNKYKPGLISFIYSFCLSISCSYILCICYISYFICHLVIPTSTSCMQAKKTPPKTAFLKATLVPAFNYKKNPWLPKDLR